jgi:hypothetical protein
LNDQRIIDTDRVGYGKIGLAKGIPREEEQENPEDIPLSGPNA